MSVNTFKDKCLAQSAGNIVQQYLIEGSCYFFNKLCNEDEEYLFKKNLALSLGVHIRDIVIVGSSKLGYSLKPEKHNPGLYLFKEFDHNYKRNSARKKSDLDIAIVSSSLFDEQLVSIYEHTDCYSNSRYNETGSRNAFAKLILKGRLSTKFIPRSYVVSQEIKDSQIKYSRKYNREINYEIYKSWYFFEKYHVNNIKTIKINLIASA